MKKVFIFGFAVLIVSAGLAQAQMMGSGQHMMGTAQQPPAQIQQGTQPYYGMMGYGMYPGMMAGTGMYPGMMGGYGMPMPMMGYGMMPMHPGMMGYGTAPCMSVHSMHQPMMGYGMGYGMQPGMMGGSGMPHMYPGAGGDLEKQRAFLKNTSKLRRKLHDLMFDYMEAQWQADAKPEQLEKIGKEIQGLQQEIFEISREALKQ